MKEGEIKICGNKFEYKYNTISLPVEFKELPSNLIVENFNLFLKSSFHVSLVCIGKIIEKNSISIANFEDNVINDFCEFSKSNELRVLEFNDFRFVFQNDRRSIVVMCKISNLNNFFDFINNKYNLNLEYPPTHVTLYTLESRNGIFLTDSSDIKNLTKLISNPTGHLL